MKGKSLYKVGDQVMIKSKYDEGCGASDYTWGFLEEMRKKFGGKICTIDNVMKETTMNDHKILDDGYTYNLKEDYDRYWWSSGCFEPEF